MTLLQSYLIDIGINLTSSQYRTDVDQVIKRAYASQVSQMVITGTSELESQLALQLGDKYDPTLQHLFSTAGVHPHHAKDWNSHTHATISALLQNPRVKAVGECGLDFNRNFSPRAAQEKAFNEQLALAVALQKPVFMHERDAADTFCAILRDYRDQLSSAVVHCFTGEKKALFAYLDMDLYIGITGWICDERRGLHLQELVKAIPANRLMLETDGPYLLPRTLKEKPDNRRNEPAYLPEVCRIVAQCRAETPQHTAWQTSQNAREFFNLPMLERANTE